MKVAKAFELKIDNPCIENFDAMSDELRYVLREMSERSNRLHQTHRCRTDRYSKEKAGQILVCTATTNSKNSIDTMRLPIITEKKPFRLWIGIMTFIAFEVSEVRMHR